MHITDYEKVSTLNETDVFLLDGERGTKTMFAKDLGSSVIQFAKSKDVTDKIDIRESKNVSTNTSDTLLFYQCFRRH